MSYKALYRTYRPKTFNEVVGQGHIIKTLKNIILNDKLSHAYLFSGPRGTGKTSVAKILANTINCKDMLDKFSPCFECKICQERNSMDVIEIDAASNNGVAEIRRIIDNAKYAPSSAEYKVYIIDEVHMLTSGAFNALLKILEEPPKHVVFILATTEPYKIPITILSRTQRFNFRRITDEIISSQLKMVLDKEKIVYEESAIQLITTLSKGGMRDALSIADQSAAFSQNNIREVDILQVFGLISKNSQIELLNATYKHSTTKMLSYLSEFIQNGADLQRLNNSLIETLKDFIVYKKTSDKSFLNFLDEEDINLILFDINFAYSAMEIFVLSNSHFRFSETPKQLIELSLLKILDLQKNTKKEAVHEVRKIEEEKVKIIPEVIKENVFVEKKDEVEVDSDDFMAIFSEKVETSVVSVETNSIDLINEQIQIQKESKKEFIESNNKREFDSLEMTMELKDEAQNLTKTTSILDPGTSEDLLSLFDETEVVEKKQKKSDSWIEHINILLNSKRSFLELYKNEWDKIKNYIDLPKYAKVARALSMMRIVSASESFILVSSKDDVLIEQLNYLMNDKCLVELTQLVFGEPLRIFVITKEEFNFAKIKYGELKTNNSLPMPKAIHKLRRMEIVKSKDDKFAEDIFGDLYEG